MPKRKMSKNQLFDFWWENYVASADGCAHQCTLCGGCGVIDTRTALSPLGTRVGRLNYCLCPNGRISKEKALPLRTRHMRLVEGP